MAHAYQTGTRTEGRSRPSVEPVATSAPGHCEESGRRAVGSHRKEGADIVITYARAQEHVADLAHRLANIEVEYAALTARFGPAEQGDRFAALRERIFRARLHAEGLAAAMLEP